MSKRIAVDITEYNGGYVVTWKRGPTGVRRLASQVYPTAQAAAQHARIDMADYQRQGFDAFLTSYVEGLLHGTD